MRCGKFVGIFAVGASAVLSWNAGGAEPKAAKGEPANAQAKDGTITLHSKTAQVHGKQLRYEPMPNKNTLGFWTKVEDYASFEFLVDKPGKFTVEVLQGCGKGSGGAEVEMSIGESKLTFTVKDTGGFQAFEARDVGTLTIAKPGKQTLTVRPKTKPGVAVMDLRQVVLKPAKGE